MYILKLAIQKLAARPGNTLFSVLLFAIGCSIISLIILAGNNLDNSVRRNFSQIDLVVGAKGSPLQLILSSVLHADYPTGNISLAEAENIARNPLVEKAIPIALGDNYRGFRIVGTTTEYAGLYDAALLHGNWYEAPLEAVVGANVARATGLTIGDTFYGVHGFQDGGHSHPDHLYTVTGILQPGAGVVDNLILTPVASVWKVHESHQDNTNPAGEEKMTHRTDSAGGHDHYHDETETVADPQHTDVSRSSEEDTILRSISKRVEAGEDISLEEMQLYQQYQQDNTIPGREQHGEITAMLLKFRSPAGLIQLNRTINESANMQSAAPALEINRLMSLLSVGFDTLMTLAWIIIIISGINIFIHLWNTLRYNLQDIALMRVLGASPMRVFFMLIVQGGLIALAGWVLGVIVSRLVWLLLPSFHFITEAGLVNLYSREVMLLYYTLIIGVLASLFPAWKAYSTDVHFTLTRKTS